MVRRARRWWRSPACAFTGSRTPASDRRSTWSARSGCCDSWSTGAATQASTARSRAAGRRRAAAPRAGQARGRLSISRASSWSAGGRAGARPGSNGDPAAGACGPGSRRPRRPCGDLVAAQRRRSQKTPMSRTRMAQSRMARSRIARSRIARSRVAWPRVGCLAGVWLPRPHMRHPWPHQRFPVSQPRCEPCAGRPHGRCCAGGAA